MGILGENNRRSFPHLRAVWDTQIRNRLARSSIRVHITGLYLLILVASTALSSALYRELYAGMTMTRVSEASMQTLDSILANLDAVVRNANNTSKMILSDSDLQALLSSGDLYSDLRLQGRIRSFLYKVLQDTPDIDSIHLFDMTGNQYAISRRSRQSPPEFTLWETDWYRDAVNAKGSYVLRLNGGGDFPGDEKGNRVSLIRSVRDINTTASIGTLVVNISEEAFRQAFGTISQRYETSFLLLDEHGEPILSNVTLTPSQREALEPFLAQGVLGSGELQYNRDPFLVSFRREPTHGWTLISQVPTASLSSENMPALLTGFVVIGLNGFLLFVGLLVVSRMITTPIGQLLGSMRQVEAGALEPWNIKAGNREILQLRDSYNRMIERIRLLLRRVVEEQRAKRHHELNVLQAQIKPHFLYNTLDSINALALMGEQEDVVKIVDALGIYYRLSLGRGREVVTVGDEVEMVRQYLSIQKIRYGDMFEVTYDIDENAQQCPLLKLVLQPLVENALYHGIRASGRKGALRLVTRRNGEQVRIDIEDDGNGMQPETIVQALQMESGKPVSQEDSNDSAIASRGSGFGLRGTVERLRILYGYDDVISIQSNPGEGTRVTLSVPARIAPFVKGTERILNGAGNVVHDTLQAEEPLEENIL